MKINYNASAAITNKHLLGIENKMGTSMERLSSGFKINKSKDNPAGMAISNKMRAQIDGLNRASKNSSNGISIIHIADGALNETSGILTRMRELAVQAANDATLSLEDKQAIQSEIESLKQEVDRISTDTEYNAKPLLDGTLDTRVYTEHVTRVNISDYVSPGDYSLTVLQPATQAKVMTNGKDFNSDTAIVGVSGHMKINGYDFSIDAGDTLQEAYEKIRKAGEVGETFVRRDETTGDLTFTADAYGKESIEKITFDSKELADALGFTADADGNSVIKDEANGVYVYGSNNNGTITYPAGKDMELNDTNDWVGFGKTATAYFEGNKVTISDVNGFSFSFKVDANYANGQQELDVNGLPTGNTYDGVLNFEVTDMGTMTLQIGANMDQNMEVRIPNVSTESLYIDELDVTTVNGADRAIIQLDEAVSMVSAIRSRLGAYENRLEHTGKNLDAFEENMTNALSGLTDVDMAEEMTNYTQQSVLNQAAISVLTQANDMPQQVLSILQ